MKLFVLLLKNVWRNKLRTILTSLAVVTLVAIFSMILSVLRFLEDSMAEKTRDIRTVMTERYRIPSRFDMQFVDQVVRPGYEVNTKLQEVPGFHGEKHATWHFIVFTLDPEMKDKNLIFFAIATQPEKIPFMIDGLEGFDATVTKMVTDPPSGLPNQGILFGASRLEKLGRKVGETLSIKSVSHRQGNPGRTPLEMEFQIVGTLPADSRWTEAAFIDQEYLNRVMEQTNCELANKVNLGWLMIDDQPSTDEVLTILENDQTISRELKTETAATAVGRFMAPLEDLLDGVKYLLMPAIVIVMIVIVANAISITVRERVKEIGVLKVLGFTRGKILALVLGEGMLIGMLSGLISGAVTILLVNYVLGGIKVPLGFFGVFLVPWHALWWGTLLGGLSALFGGFLPAWNGCSIKVSEIFAKVA